MTLENVDAGTMVLLADGGRAEVLSVQGDRKSARIKYIDTMGDLDLIGKEAVVLSDDVVGVSPDEWHTEGPV